MKGRNWTAGAHSAELWARAAEFNETSRVDGAGWEWVPKEAIDFRPELQPRADAVPDPVTVQAYADVWEQLPPVTVQRGSFVLIDGRHRYAACPSDLIRIVEMDVPDDELFLYAVRANTAHGRAYSLADRKRAVDRLLKAYPDRKDVELAEAVGVHRQTVAGARHRLAGHTPDNRSARPNDVENRHSSHVSKTPVPTPKPAVRSFDPGADDVPWDDDGPAETEIGAASEAGAVEAGSPGPAPAQMAEDPELVPPILRGIEKLRSTLADVDKLVVGHHRSSAFELACEAEERMTALARAIGRWAR
jgi:hypothetical protein